MCNLPVVDTANRVIVVNERNVQVADDGQQGTDQVVEERESGVKTGDHEQQDQEDPVDQGDELRQLAHAHGSVHHLEDQSKQAEHCRDDGQGLLEKLCFLPLVNLVEVTVVKLQCDP